MAKEKGSNADGVLDEDALMAMVSQWQSNRLKNRALATPDQLLTPPTADFYDPSRADELRQVERKTYAAYKEMIAAAIADPPQTRAYCPANLRRREVFEDCFFVSFARIPG